MTALLQESPDRFRVGFAALARARRGALVQVDPYLIGRAVAAVMQACAIRSAAGRRLLWNDYRVFLAPADFELIRALQGPLERDLAAVLEGEVRASDAELVGDLRVTVIADEGGELVPGDAVVRVAFAPAERLAALPGAGEMTVRFDRGVHGGLIAARLPAAPPAAAPLETVVVDDRLVAPPACRLAWPGGEVALPLGAMVILGRPHPGAPPHLIALTGAGARVNKQHCWLEVRPGAVRIGRFAGANPVAVNGQLLAAPGELEVPLPAELALSHGDLVIALRRS